MIKIFLVSLGATSMAIVSAISRYSLSRGAGSFQTVEMFGNLTDAICPDISEKKIGRDWYPSIALGVPQRPLLPPFPSTSCQEGPGLSRWRRGCLATSLMLFVRAFRTENLGAIAPSFLAGLFSLRVLWDKLDN